MIFIFINYIDSNGGGKNQLKAENQLYNYVN